MPLVPNEATPTDRWSLALLGSWHPGIYGEDAWGDLGGTCSGSAPSAKRSATHSVKYASPSLLALAPSMPPCARGV